MKRPVLIFDLDSTLNRLHDVWLQLIKERLGEEIRYEDCTRWEYPLGQSKYLQVLWDEPDVFERLPEEPGMIPLLHRLHDEGYDIVVCSASHPATVVYKERWVLERLPFLRPTDIIYAHRKELLAATDHILIDDGPHNVVGFMKRGGMAILYDRPWNREVQALRAFNAGDVEDLIRELTVWYQNADAYADRLLQEVIDDVT